MQVIIDFFQGIGNAITSALDFLASIIADIAWVCQLVGKAVTEIPSYFSWLPAPVLAGLVACLAVVVVFRILGRD